MSYDNKHTDKKLQELEQQSLPDLSKMDKHWEEMSSVLSPGVMPKKIISGKKLLVAFSGIAILLVISFFVFRNLQPSNNISLNGATRDTLPAKATVSADLTHSTNDTILLKAKTSEGRDTLLKAVPVNKPSPNNNKILLEKFYTELQKKPQRFIINNLRDTVINGKEGTRLYIPANSFNTKESFTLLLTEFYSVNDMITNKLTTASNGRQLVSGGMIYLDARDKNENPVDLKNQASLRLDIPKQDNQQQMELFYGYDYYRNDITEVMDSINWNRTNEVFTDAKANPAKSFLLINTSVSISKKDSIRLMELGDLPKTFDYATKDTVPGKTSITIKGDSIILQKFGVNIQQLGWINCDRFYNDSRPRLELIVDIGDNPDNYNTLLVFDNFASIIRPSSKNGTTIRFFNLPEGEPARVVSVGIRNDKAVTALQKVKISKTPVTDMKFEEVSPLAYKKKLDQ